jgi:arylsulfatase A-like enzyme
MYRGRPEETEFGFEATETHVGTSVYEDDYGRWLRNREGDDRRGTGLSHEPTDARPWHRVEFEHPTNWTTRRALNFLESREESRPFFLALSYVRPHAPLDPPQVYWDQYADRDLPEPVVGSWLDRLRDDPDATPTLREEPPRRDQRLRTGYYGLVSQIDHQLHRVLYELQWRHGIRDDTIVVFTSDHGEMLGDHHHWAKEAPFQGSARIPMVLDLPDGVGPEQPSGQIVDRPVGLEDVMPTLLDLAGVDVPDTVEGEGLHELVTDPGRDDHRDAYHGESGTRPASHYLVENDRKYVWFPDAGEELLFDLAADPEETTDVSRDSYYVEDLERSRERLAERLAVRDEGFVEDGELVGLGA